MNNYIPFLKTKTGEFGAIKTLEMTIKEELTPFLELQFNKEADSDWLKDKMPKIKRKIEINLNKTPFFYFDNYNIDSDMVIDGINNYQYILETLKDLPVIPVVSTDRHPDHNQSVFNLKSSGDIESDVLAIRLTSEHFQNYHLTQLDLINELGTVIPQFDQIDLILDCRVCLNTDTAEAANNIIDFTVNFAKDYNVRRVIVAGSSIPPSIADLLPPISTTTVERQELAIYRNVQLLSSDFDLYLGDYGSVSPDFSEIDIIPEAMRNVTAPKIIYAYDDNHFILRGGALATHPRGDDQYYDLSGYLEAQPFFRGPGYSEGGKFFKEKSKSLGPKVTPASIVKPTLNSHITYMMKGWS
ncbi:beta family protein [Desulfogranum japonicum]|uniref:beta family protein n=1 Tax=Desulfogranum japonicum TaxID=231447 RepID=UPI000404B548|nr:beta family protein [Desulfogranum japonicum]